jgi:hypothetical protein
MRTAIAIALLAACATSPARAAEWTFGVFLDEKRIGSHQFVVARLPDGDVQVTSDAQFDVKLMGLTVFRYRHRAEERWRDGCLVAIESATRVNRKEYRVEGRSDVDGFAIVAHDDAGARADRLPACVATYAYWNPDLLRRHASLLNSQTGAYQAVTRRDAAIEDGGDLVELAGDGFTIALRYRSADGFWEGLSTTTRDGRTLHYRLEAAPGTAL